MSDSDSDIEMKATLPKTSVKKIPYSPQEHLKREPKKLSTKEMIHTALEELKTRKGVSLYAIKKYMVERFNTNTEKINFYIKKYIKHGLESGVIIQTKGIGVTGSFKLAPPKNAEKKTKTKKTTKKKIEKSEKPEKKPKDSTKSKTVKKGAKTEKKVEGKPKIIKEKPTKTTTKVSKKVTPTEDTEKEPKKKMQKKKMAEKPTPATKKTKLVKRKSIGSIIKPPKMKPK